MILIDDKQLLEDSYHVDGVYHVDNRQGCANVDKVILDGVVVKMAMACDVNRGVVISTKMTIDGRPLISDNEIIHELRFGKVEVVLNELE